MEPLVIRASISWEGEMRRDSYDHTLGGRRERTTARHSSDFRQTDVITENVLKWAMLDVLMQVAGNAEMRTGNLNWMNGGES